MALNVMRRINDRYTLLEPIGRGGMGTVWRARDERLGRLVAVKEILPPAGLTPEEQEILSARTLREARAAARLNSRGAVTVYDVLEQDDRPWIVMELLDARSLSEVLRDEGPLAPEHVARIGVAVLDALDAAHSAGVVHRDVKPANVLLCSDGRVVLTDFGIAALDGDPTLTTTGTVLGSPAYMAPERAHGHEPSPAMDLWSLGATLYAAIDGRSPFQRSTALTTLNAVLTEEVPRPPASAGALGPLLEGLLDKDPEQRIDAPRAHELLARALRQPAPLPTPKADTPTRVIDLAAADRMVAVSSGLAPALTADTSARNTPVREAAPPVPVRAHAPAAPVRDAASAAPVRDAAAAAPGRDAAPALAPVAEPARTSPVGAPERTSPSSSLDRTVAAVPVQARPERSDDVTGPVPPAGAAPRHTGASRLEEGAPRRRWPLGVVAGLLLLALVAGALAFSRQGASPAENASPPAGPASSAAQTPPAVVPAPVSSASASSGLASPSGSEASPSASASASASSSKAPAAAKAPASTPSAEASASEPSAKATKSAKPSPKTSAAQSAPAGFHSYRDSTGFALSVPNGWKTERKGGRVYFRESGGGRFLSIDQTRSPQADPEADWRRQEPAVASRFPGYQRISINSVSYRGWRAADWEFRWNPSSSGPLHVRNRNVVTGPSRAYALYFSVPESRWASSQGVFSTLADSFQPAAG